MTTTRFGLSRIGQVLVPVRDLGRATAFYRAVLGLSFLFEAPPAMAFFRAGDVRLLLGVPEGDEPLGASILYFRVDDIQTAHRELEGRGVRFVQAPHSVHRAETYDLWLAFFRDSEENTLALMSEVPR
jgi:predicted enzyme related to lactoylglutathione lyase